MAELLRDAIKAGESSRRKLSFQLAEKTGNQQPSEYRALGKYLKGDEAPTKDRAAILAVLLREPRLALVSDAQSRRQDRLGELAKTVDDLIATVADLKEQVEELQRRPGAARRASGGR